MLELFLQVRCAIADGTVVPERDFGAGFQVSGRAHDHHVADECAAGSASTAVVDIRCLRPDAARMMSLFFCGLVSWGRELIKGLSVRSQARGWTAKDVEGDDSIDEEPGHVILVSIDHLRLRLKAHLRINYWLSINRRHAHCFVSSMI